MYSTVGDLLEWEHGLFGGKLMNATSLKLLTTPGKGSYGLGVFVGENKNGVKIVSHGGAIEGFNTSLLYVPDQRIAVIVLSNVNGTAPQQISDQLLTLALDGRR